jgi:hypothetical protein
MGGIISRSTKIKVIRDWLNGLTRGETANRNDVGDGTVTGIIQDAMKQEEYNDIDLLREVSKKLRKEGLDLPSLGFAIRIQRIMEENDINGDQLEPIIQEFAIYCLKYQIPYDTLIKFGREALYLEMKYGIPIERIPEYIAQGKHTIDRLEGQRQEILRQAQIAREARDARRQELDELADKNEKYRKEIPSIQRICKLEYELENEKRMNKMNEIRVTVLTKERDSAEREAARLAADVIELEADKKNLEWEMSLCVNKLDKLNDKATTNQSHDSIS